MSVNQEEILQMAQDAGFVNFAIPPEVAVVFYRFASLVRNKALDDVLNCYSPDDTASDYLEKIQDMKDPE